MCSRLYEYEVSINLIKLCRWLQQHVTLALLLHCGQICNIAPRAEELDETLSFKLFSLSKINLDWGLYLSFLFIHKLQKIQFIFTKSNVKLIFLYWINVRVFRCICPDKRTRFKISSFFVADVKRFLIFFCLRKKPFAMCVCLDFPIFPTMKWERQWRYDIEHSTPYHVPWLDTIAEDDVDTKIVLDRQQNTTITITILSADVPPPPL